MPSGSVAEVVHELHTRFAGARVREYVPLFVERRANAALEELSVSYDSLPPVPPVAAGRRGDRVTTGAHGRYRLMCA